MYKATIKTKTQTLTLKIENPEDSQFQELCNQPDIEEVKLEKIMTKEELIEEQRRCLWHITGTSYWNGKALELKKRIEEE